MNQEPVTPPRAHFLSDIPFPELHFDWPMITPHFRNPAIQSQPIDYSLGAKLSTSNRPSGPSTVGTAGVTGTPPLNQNQTKHTPIVGISTPSFSKSTRHNDPGCCSDKCKEVIMEAFKRSLMTTVENGKQRKKGTPKRKKSFQCHICDKFFSYKHVLQNHGRTHTGEKPYKCSICSKAFNRDHHLKVHVRSHTGERPYQCCTCGKTFNQVANLRRHERVHHYHHHQRLSTCRLCGIRCVKIEHLDSHIATGHKETTAGIEGTSSSTFFSAQSLKNEAPSKGKVSFQKSTNLPQFLSESRQNAKASVAEVLMNRQEDSEVCSGSRRFKTIYIGDITLQTI